MSDLTIGPLPRGYRWPSYGPDRGGYGPQPLGQIRRPSADAGSPVVYPSYGATDAEIARWGEDFAAQVQADADAATGPAPKTDLAVAGYITSIAGAIAQSAGAYFSYQGMREQEKAKASSLQFAADMEAINARAAMLEAEHVRTVGQEQIAQVTLAAGAAKAARRARTAAAGIKIDAGGSYREAQASDELTKQIDVYNIRRNTVAAENAARAGVVNTQNRGRLLAVSADNAARSAAGINPFAAAGGTAAKAASEIAMATERSRRYRDRNSETY